MKLFGSVFKSDTLDAGSQPWRKLNLIYLVFVFLPLLMPLDLAPLKWALTVLAVLLFLPIYWRSYVQKPADALRSALLIALLGFALIFVHAGGGSFIVYAMATLGFHQKPRTALVVGLSLQAFMLLLFAGLGYPIIAVLPMLVISLAMMAGAIFGRREMLRNAQLHLSQTEVVRHAKNAERERISRDLHDLLGHTLSVIAMKSELARKLAPRDLAAAISEISEVERISRDALAQVREAVTGMRTTEFSAELASARVTLMSAGVAVQINEAALSLTMPETHAQVLGLALREAITNVLRHAQASRVEIALKQTDTHWQLCVQDDGVGIGPRLPGNGLSGMQARLQCAGGELQWRAATLGIAGGGTLLLAQLPNLPNQTSMGSAAEQPLTQPPLASALAAF
jgi:two-component system, NarL family, sensor histidine kinase DesK